MSVTNEYVKEKIMEMSDIELKAFLNAGWLDKMDKEGLERTMNFAVEEYYRRKNKNEE